MAGRFPAKAKKVVVESYVLTPTDALAVTSALPSDANDYYYSACISVVDGLRAIEAGFYTWSTVKMYYAVYYSLRSLLARDNIVFFYPHEAPFSARAVAGTHPTWVSGRGSHKAMSNCFRASMPTHSILSQPIDFVDGLEWLMDKRESANYGTPRFCEPEVPEHYEQIATIGVRKAIAAYLGPGANLLSFDKDHAIVAFPLAVLQSAGDASAKAGGAVVSPEELKFLKAKAKERGAALAPVIGYIERTLVS